MTDDANPWGISEYFKIDYLPELPDDAIDALVSKAAEARSPFTGVFLAALGGALARTDRTTMALEVPDAKWYYFCEALWWDPAAAAAEIAWAHAFKDTMRPWAVDKAPANFISADEGQTRLRASYGDQKYERLVALKNIYDPGNVFALNPNIAPTAATGERHGPCAVPGWHMMVDDVPARVDTLIAESLYGDGHRSNVLHHGFAGLSREADGPPASARPSGPESGSPSPIRIHAAAAVCATPPDPGPGRAS